MRQIKFDSGNGTGDEQLWLADLGSIRFVATLVASFLNDIIYNSMVIDRCYEREGFVLRYESYKQALEELVSGMCSVFLS
jgi:hypothetical protein